MLFTLEALNAAEGDSLLLLYGTARRPRLIVIDGGPRETCRAALLPRLLELRDTFPGGRRAPLLVELAVVTHVDSDHIAGLVALTGRLRAASADDDGPPILIKELWHNSFDAALGAKQVAQALRHVERLPAASDEGVVASVAEGHRLAEDAEALGIAVNVEFSGLVLRADDGGVEVPCGDGLTLTVLAPAYAQLEAFRREWQASLSRTRGAVATTGGLDTSRPNLASIVLLAESGGRSILLTGDARGDHILAGLETAGKLSPDGTMHVDVLKLPHHGSCHNNTAELLTRVTADTYVVSADGKHGNPDQETLERLAEARAGARYTVACTFPADAEQRVNAGDSGADERRAALHGFETWAARQTGRGVTVIHVEPGALGVAIPLGDERL